MLHFPILHKQTLKLILFHRLLRFSLSMIQVFQLQLELSWVGWNLEAGGRFWARRVIRPKHESWGKAAPSPPSCPTFCLLL